MTEDEQSNICEKYLSGGSLEKIAREYRTNSYIIKNVLHDNKIKQYPICKHYGNQIVYAHDRCQRCYFKLRYKEDVSSITKPKRDPLLDTTDDSIIRFYNAGIKVYEIAKMMKLSEYTIRQELNKAGKLNMKKCKTPGCDGVLHSRGLCRTCYNNQYRASRRKDAETPAELKMRLESLTTELRSKNSLYKCFTMAVPIERRVDIHKDIMAVRREIKLIKAKLKG